ncbi:MAG: LysR substrate-binding domain-containing protein [Woeseiaceae bacterium]|nr:LysR substrate-binding domain-containing protein [Woeseiaceae bacterium]
MSKNTISLRGIRTFCMAARYESFRDAAERMFVTASAVSHQIKNLEDELGLRLFERNARNLKLTDTGKALFDEVSPLIDELDETVARYQKSRPRSRLNISVQPFFASERFVPKLPEFTKANPDIDIKIDTSDEASQKHAGSWDASIRVFKSPPAGLISHRLFPLRLLPAGSPEFKKKLKVKKNRIESEFPLIVHEGRGNAWKKWQRVSGITLPEDSSSVRLASMIAVVRAAEKGLGAALVPMELAQGWFDSGSLVPLFDTPLVTDETYYFISDEKSAEMDNVRLLREWVLNTFAIDD